MNEFADNLIKHLTDYDIKTVEIISSNRGHSFHGSEVSLEAKNITDAARERHIHDGYGFWENAIAQSSWATPEVRDRIFSRAIQESDASKHREQIPIEELYKKLTDGSLRELPGRRLVVLNSRMWTSKEEVYLQMLDFSLPSTPENADIAQAAMKTLGIKGLLVDSGRSYHVYGQTIKDWVEYTSFLATAALLSPIVDSRWALHQLVQKEANLRISNNVGRHEKPPQFIKAVR
jgi:hypothetical protein